MVTGIVTAASKPKVRRVHAGVHAQPALGQAPAPTQRPQSAARLRAPCALPCVPAQHKAVSLTVQCKTCKGVMSVACRPGMGGAMVPSYCTLQSQAGLAGAKEKCEKDPYQVRVRHRRRRQRASPASPTRLAAGCSQLLRRLSRSARKHTQAGALPSMVCTARRGAISCRCGRAGAARPVQVCGPADAQAAGEARGRADGRDAARRHAGGGQAAGGARHARHARHGARHLLDLQGALALGCDGGSGALGWRTHAQGGGGGARPAGRVARSGWFGVAWQTHPTRVQRRCPASASGGHATRCLEAKRAADTPSCARGVACGAWRGRRGTRPRAPGSPPCCSSPTSAWCRCTRTPETRTRASTSRERHPSV